MKCPHGVDRADRLCVTCDNKDLRDENAQLKAENERLRKSGSYSSVGKTCGLCGATIDQFGCQCI